MRCPQGLKLSVSVPHVEVQRELDLGISFPLEEVLVSDKIPSRLGSGKVVSPESEPCEEQNALAYFNIVNGSCSLSLAETQGDFSPVFTVRTSKNCWWNNSQKCGEPPYNWVPWSCSSQACPH